MIKAVIFDIGGVLQIWQNEPMYADIKETLGVSDEVFNVVFHQTLIPFSKGTISEEEFWKRFSKETKTTKPLPTESLLTREYKKLFKTDQQILSLVTKIKTNGYLVAALTNSNPAHTKFNREKGLYDIFPLQIISDEVGFVKPEKEMYEIALKRVDVLPEETVFIDDLEENIAVAKEFGMQGIVYQNITQLEKDLTTLGVKTT